LRAGVRVPAVRVGCSSSVRLAFVISSLYFGEKCTVLYLVSVLKMNDKPQRRVAEERLTPYTMLVAVLLFTCGLLNDDQYRRRLFPNGTVVSD
jgi:hypothetical protein